MKITPHIVLLVIACVCFALALLADVSTFTTNTEAWRDGGLLLFALAFVPR